MQDAPTYRAAKDAGLEIPDEIKPPEFLPGLRLWFDDFFELSTDRQIGMAIGEIPAASIDRHTAGWLDEDREMFRICMRRMDAVFRAKPEEREEVSDDPNAARDAFRAAMR